MHVLVQDVYVLCAADGHAHACVRGGATYTTGTEMQQDAGPPSAQPPSPPNEPSFNRKPMQVAKTPYVAHVFRDRI